MEKKTPPSEKVATEVTINVPSPVRIGKRSPLPDLNSLLPKKHKAKPIPRIGPALALSGGAAHGDFEVGVVSYLYQHGLKPKIICGTSVGAINGLKLAEGEPKGAAKPDADGYIQGLAGLIDIWKSLRFNFDMYKMRDITGKLKDALKNFVMGAGAGSLVGGSVGGPFGLLIGAVIGGRVEEDQLISAIKDLLSTNSLANFNPLDDLMQKPSSFKTGMVKKSKIMLRMAATALEDGALRMVDENGRLLNSDGTQVNAGPTYDAATQAKIDQLQEEIDGVWKSFDDPNSTVKEQVSEVLKLRQQLAAVKASGRVTGEKPVQVKLTLAALASSSLPVFTPPQEFDDSKNYVDGGTKMVTPIQVAIQTGATVVYAVVASSDRTGPGESVLNQAPINSYLSANVADIGVRVGGDIEPAAINDSQLYPPLGFTVPVLIFRPHGKDIHSSLTVAPGLIDIRMDQGWMCADDVMQAWAIDSENYLDLARQYDDFRGTTDITHARHSIWKEEFAANGWQYLTDKMGQPLDAIGAPPMPVITKDALKTKAKALASVRQMKLALRDMVQKRLDAHGNIPPGAERWWNDWERHTWKPNETLWPLATMKTKATPNKNVPLFKPTTIRITATDASGKPIKGATVFAGGAKIGSTGEMITTIFQTGPHGITSVEVAADGYETTPVSIQFAGAKP